jgi:hypothetical protein
LLFASRLRARVLSKSHLQSPRTCWLLASPRFRSAAAAPGGRDPDRSRPSPGAATVGLMSCAIVPAPPFPTLWSPWPGVKDLTSCLPLELFMGLTASAWCVRRWRLEAEAAVEPTKAAALGVMPPMLLAGVAACAAAPAAAACEASM